MINIRRAFLLLPLAMAACAPAMSPPPAMVAAAPAPKAAVLPADAAFMAAVAQRSAFATQISQLAAQKVAREGVRGFAQSVVESETQASAQIGAMARGADASLPQALPPAGAKLVARMSTMADGSGFRRLYFSELIKSQIAAAKLMEDYAAKGGNAELRAFAAAQGPVLRTQIATARQLPRQR